MLASAVAVLAQEAPAIPKDATVFTGSLRRTVLAVTVTSLVVVSATVTGLALWSQRRTFGEVERLLLTTQGRVVDRLLVGRGRDLTNVADSFVRPREIQDALAAGNRDGLLDAAKPPFNRLSAQAALTQLAYYDASGSRIVALPETAAPAAGALLSTAAASPSSPPRCATSLTAAPPPPRRSRASSRMRSARSRRARRSWINRAGRSATSSPRSSRRPRSSPTSPLRRKSRHEGSIR